MTRTLLCAALCFAAALLAPVARAQSDLRVSDDRHFVVTKGGAPFFWLGDTAWELFHRLSRTEADAYLQRRAKQGFTVHQKRWSRTSSAHVY